MSIIELIVACGLMVLVTMSIPNVLLQSMPIKNTTATIELQRLKFHSIATNEQTQFSVNDGRVNDRFVSSFGNCELGWYSRSFQSGTCRNRSAHLTIMAIVGDIGYPW